MAEKYDRGCPRSTTSGELDANHLVAAVAQLEARINERFTDGELSGVCHRLLELARQAPALSQAIARPIWWVRLVAAMLVLLIVASVALLVVAIKPQAGEWRWSELVQALEAGIQNVVFIGVAAYFLMRFEERIRRGRALRAIHRLRVLAHVIDMQQLSKGPDRLVAGSRATRSSPTMAMTPFELRRYLDYCCEMLSIVGKLAAVYVQHLSDAQALDAATEVEDLTTGLAQKIWQKMIVLHSFDQQTASAAPAVAPALAKAP